MFAYVAENEYLCSGNQEEQKDTEKSEIHGNPPPAVSLSGTQRNDARRQHLSEARLLPMGRTGKGALLKL